MRRGVVALLGACHPGPAFAVTLLAGLLAGAVGLGPGRIALVVAAVLTGQLSIGWSNDLIDLARDRAVGPQDKPLVDGRVSERTVRGRLRRSRSSRPCRCRSRCGWLAGAVHLVCVAAGWAYNLGVKATPWSWLPYAVAFGGLPAFVSLTDDPDQVPPVWLPVAGALLGVGAHFVNVLPDLADDAATGVHGLPHRLGARWSQVVAAAVLVAAAVVIVVGAPIDNTVVAAVAPRRHRWPGRGGAARAGRAPRARSLARSWPCAGATSPHAGGGAPGEPAATETERVLGPRDRGRRARPARRPRSARCTPTRPCGCCSSTGPTSRATSPAATASPRTASTRSPRSASPASRTAGPR